MAGTLVGEKNRSGQLPSLLLRLSDKGGEDDGTCGGGRQVVLKFLDVECGSTNQNEAGGAGYFNSMVKSTFVFPFTAISLLMPRFVPWVFG